MYKKVPKEEKFLLLTSLSFHRFHTLQSSSCDVTSQLLHHEINSTKHLQSDSKLKMAITLSFGNVI